MSSSALASTLGLGHWSSFCAFSSVQFSRSVVSDSLRPHESQHARPPCPSPTPGVHSDSTRMLHGIGGTYSWRSGQRTGFPGDAAQDGLGPSGLQQARYTWTEVIPRKEIGLVPDSVWALPAYCFTQIFTAEVVFFFFFSNDSI